MCPPVVQQQHIAVACAMVAMVCFPSHSPATQLWTVAAEYSTTHPGRLPSIAAKEALHVPAARRARLHTELLLAALLVQLCRFYEEK
jgi:hypothetical protein